MADALAACVGGIGISPGANINYKDALAATGTGKILRTSPLVGGVDVAFYVDRYMNCVAATADSNTVSNEGQGSG